MRPVIRVSLNGRALQLEDDAHALLAQYLESAARTLDGNPDRAEILLDLEVAIVEKSARFLSPTRDVLNREQVAAVLDEVGPVEPVPDGDAESAHAAGGAEGAAPEGGTMRARPQSRRLEQITDGAMIGGVCNGLATWLGTDALIVRIVAVILAIATGGAAILAYLLLMLILPYAPQSGSTRGLPRASRAVIERIRGETAAFAHGEDWQRFRADARDAWERTQAHARRQWEAWRVSRAGTTTSPVGEAAPAAGEFAVRPAHGARDVTPSPAVVLALLALLMAVVALSH